MDNIINFQRDTKTFVRTVTMVFAIDMVLSITFSNAYSEPPERVESCESEFNDGQYTCCWTETDPADPEQIEIYKCQYCILKNNVIECTPVKPDPSPSSTRDEDISPGDIGVIEQPPTENEPPIRSDNSVSPNEDSNVIDEQQSNPNSPLTNERVPTGNVGVLEQLEDSSNNQIVNQGILYHQIILVFQMLFHKIHHPRITRGKILIKGP